jgi:hypothetical protein
VTRARCGFTFALLLLVHCERVPDLPPAANGSESRGAVQRYVFGTTDGGEISAEGMRGRVTVLVFVTTFDLASQVAAKRVNQLLHAHRPRINAAAVVLEAAKYAPLADVFRSSLELSYPVAIADLTTLEQSSTLGEVRSVPVIVVLDREGREVVRWAGAFSTSQLDGWLVGAERQ